MKKKYLVLKIEKDFISKKSKKKQELYNYLTNIYFYEDIYIYNNKEYFIDITNYQELYNKSTYQLALDLKNTLTNKYHLEVKIGLGTNLFLAKTACDIITKEKKVEIAYLDELEYISLCSKHKPLTDFHQISNSMMLKLHKLNIYTMEDIKNASYKLLYEEFGYNAENLINHALGLEPATIKELNKDKTPKRVSSCLVLKSIKTKKESKKSLKNLLDFNILRLKEEGLKTKTIYLYIKYAKNLIPKDIISIKLNESTDSYKEILKESLNAFEQKTNSFIPIEKLAISFGEIEKIPANINPVLLQKKKRKMKLFNLLYKRTKTLFQKDVKIPVLHT